MKKPIVAIVGRPNVGKSTLFNRIIRKREAIVDDKPGVTRDRNYSPAEWAGFEFDVLDTGGYVPNTTDVFETAIRRQIKLAVQEADVIVFLTDVLTGITGIDQEIADFLLQAGAPVVLAVNKVDNQKREADVFEFFQLGLGEPVPISANSGRNVGDFLDAVVKYLPRQGGSFDKNEQPLKLAVVGRPNVGKSSYINAILGQDKMIVTQIPGTTRDAVDTPMTYHKKPMVLVDTAGLRKRARVRENVEYFSNVRTFNAIRRCDVAVLLLDAVEGMTDQDKKILGYAVDEGKGIVIGVNKWDLVEKDTMTARRFELDIVESVRDVSYIPILFISALLKQRIYKLLDMAFAVFEERNHRLKTTELNAFLEYAIQKHHPPAYGDKYVKINYVTQIKTGPPFFVFFTNEPRGIKQNYKNYLENQLRRQFGFMGVPIRMQFRKKNK